MTVKIKKLTPPQIAALRESLPACVEAGVIVTTNSIVEFRDGAVETFGHITKGKVRALLNRKAVDADNHVDDVPMGRALQKIIEKLDTRPDLIEES